MLKEWYKIYSTLDSLVHCVIILICRGHRLPYAAGDQTVTESHPDAFPDVHLDLVVILKTFHIVIMLYIFSALPGMEGQ